MVNLYNVIIAIGLNLAAIASWVEGVPKIPHEDQQFIVSGVVSKVQCKKRSAKHIEYGNDQRFQLAVFNIKKFKCEESRENWTYSEFVAYFPDGDELFSPFKVEIGGSEIYGEEQYIFGKKKSIALFTILATISNVFWLYYLLIYKRKRKKLLN